MSWAPCCTMRRSPSAHSATLATQTSAMQSASRQHPRYRQRRDQHAAIALCPQLGGKLVGDVPREDDGAFRLVLEHPALLHHGDERAGHALADLERAFDLADVVDDGLVEPDIV